MSRQWTRCTQRVANTDIYRIGKARDKSTKDFMEWFYGNRISWNGVLIATGRGCHQTWWSSKCWWEIWNRQVDWQEAEGCVSLSELSECFRYQHVLTSMVPCRNWQARHSWQVNNMRMWQRLGKRELTKTAMLSLGFSRSVLFLHPTRLCETLQPVS